MCRCYIVPPYLLQQIASSSANPTTIRQSASNALQAQSRVATSRAARLSILATPRGSRGDAWSRLNSRRSIVPEELLRQISESAEVDDAARERARSDLEHIEQVTARYKASQQSSSLQDASSSDQALAATDASQSLAAKPPKKPKVYRAIYDAKHSQDEGSLPGALVRVEGQQPVKDQAINSSYTNFGLVFEFYQKYFKWNSIDNKGMHIVASCHFGENYENACKYLIPISKRAVG